MIYGVHALAPDASPGQRLRYARQAMRLSQEDVSRLLRLHLHIIQALEEDNYEVVPAPLFVRGYLRAYARLVKVTEEEVIACYNNLTGAVKEPDEQPYRPAALKSSRSWGWSAAKWWIGNGLVVTVLILCIILCLFWL